MINDEEEGIDCWKELSEEQGIGDCVKDLNYL